VLGPIDTADLGFTLMHEHFMVVNPAMRLAFPDWIDRETIITNTVKELKTAKDHGVQTVVEVTPINAGRDIHLIREVAEKADVQTIVSTGFYITEEPLFSGWSTDNLVEKLLPEIQQGIQGTDIKVGIIKCGTGELGVTATNRKLLETASHLHLSTGLPITTHSEPSKRNGLDQLDVFEAERVDLSKVVIGHCDDAFDLDYLQELMNRGCYIGFDRFGVREYYPSDDERIECLLRLLEMGYENKIVVSHDCSCYNDIAPIDLFQEAKTNTMPEWRYYHFPRNVIPFLLEKGVENKQIQMMTVKNPRRIFENQRPG
jgi:phosphotriesterase-related protein